MIETPLILIFTGPRVFSVNKDIERRVKKLTRKLGCFYIVFEADLAARKSERGDDALERVERGKLPFFEGEVFKAGFGLSVFEGDTIFTAEEDEDGRRNKAMKDDLSSYAQGKTRSQDQSK
jgi:hypothetical protein